MLGLERVELLLDGARHGDGVRGRRLGDGQGQARLAVRARIARGRNTGQLDGCDVTEGDGRRDRSRRCIGRRTGLGTPGSADAPPGCAGGATVRTPTTSCSSASTVAMLPVVETGIFSPPSVS